MTSFNKFSFSDLVFFLIHFSIQICMRIQIFVWALCCMDRFEERKRRSGDEIQKCMRFCMGREKRGVFVWMVRPGNKSVWIWICMKSVDEKADRLHTRQRDKAHWAMLVKRDDPSRLSRLWGPERAPFLFVRNGLVFLWFLMLFVGKVRYTYLHVLVCAVFNTH